jgi:hypothetical protein
VALFDGKLGARVGHETDVVIFPPDVQVIDASTKYKHIKYSGEYTNSIYILEYNPHPVFGGFLNGKKLGRGSNPHLSFNHPLPTGRLI